jgi:hypothetical protein
MGRRRNCAGKLGCVISLSSLSGLRDSAGLRDGGCGSSRHFLFPCRPRDGSRDLARTLESPCAALARLIGKVYSRTN